MQLGNIWYIIWNLMCGFAQNQPQLLVFRILAGIGASVTSGVGGGVLSDVWRPEQRGRGLSIYSLAPGSYFHLQIVVFPTANSFLPTQLLGLHLGQLVRSLLCKLPVFAY